MLDSFLDRQRNSKALKGVASREEGLLRLNVLSADGGVSLAGLLAFGAYPQQFFPKLAVDVAVHPGLKKSDPVSPTRFVDRAICEGPIGEVVEDAFLTIARNLRTRSVVRGLSRVDEFEIPEEALREALANALVHREYGDAFVGQAVSVDIFPDRIEFTNPGGLWGGKTAENLADGISACRNATLMKLMAAISLGQGSGAPVEGNGGGVPLMQRAMAERDLAEPVFLPGIDRFKVTFLREGSDGARAKALASGSVGVVAAPRARWARDEWDHYIIAALEGNESMGVGELSEALGRPADSIRPHLRRLVANGTIEATARPSSKNRRYKLVRRT